MDAQTVGQGLFSEADDFFVTRSVQELGATGKDQTKGFPFTGDPEDHEDDILGYKNGGQCYQRAVLKIVGMDVPLVLSAPSRACADGRRTKSSRNY